jgi:hypothetical protein
VSVFPTRTTGMKPQAYSGSSLAAFAYADSGNAVISSARSEEGYAWQMYTSSLSG